MRKLLITLIILLSGAVLAYNGSLRVIAMSHPEPIHYWECDPELGQEWSICMIGYFSPAGFLDALETSPWYRLDNHMASYGDASLIELYHPSGATLLMVAHPEMTVWSYFPY